MRLFFLVLYSNVSHLAWWQVIKVKVGKEAKMLQDDKTSLSFKKAEYWVQSDVCRGLYGSSVTSYLLFRRINKGQHDEWPCIKIWDLLLQMAAGICELKKKLFINYKAAVDDRYCKNHIHSNMCADSFTDSHIMGYAAFFALCLKIQLQY